MGRPVATCRSRLSRLPGQGLAARHRGACAPAGGQRPDRHRGRRQPGRDQPARRRHRQHAARAARRRAGAARRRHRPRRRVRGAARPHGAVHARGARPGRGLRRQQVPRRRRAARLRPRVPRASAPACPRSASCPCSRAGAATKRTRWARRPRRRAEPPAPLQVAVVRLPFIEQHHRLRRAGRRARRGRAVRRPARPSSPAHALVVLPGTKSTMADLAWLRERGLDAAIVRAAARRRAGRGHLRRLPDARPPHARPRRRGVAPAEARGSACST